MLTLTDTTELTAETMPSVPMTNKIFHAIWGLLLYTNEEATERRSQNLVALDAEVRKGTAKLRAKEAEWLARDRKIVEEWIEKTMRLPQHLQAGLLFYDVAAGDAGRMDEGLAALKAAGIKTKVLSARDECSECRFVQVDEFTDIGEDAWWKRIEDIVTPFDGEVTEAGLA